MLHHPKSKNQYTSVWFSMMLCLLFSLADLANDKLQYLILFSAFQIKWVYLLLFKFV